MTKKYGFSWLEDTNMPLDFYQAESPRNKNRETRSRGTACALKRSPRLKMSSSRQYLTLCETDNLHNVWCAIK